MMAASRSACWSTLARRSARSTLPASSQATTTTRMPAMTAHALFVQWESVGAEPVGVLVGLGAQVGEVDVARLVAGHHHHAHAGHDRAGGVGAVRGAGDQADVAGLSAAAGGGGGGAHRPGELPLRPG